MSNQPIADLEKEKETLKEEINDLKERIKNKQRILEQVTFEINKILDLEKMSSVKSFIENDKIHITQIKRDSIILIDKNPCKVRSIKFARSSKHPTRKAMIDFVNLFTWQMIRNYIILDYVFVPKISRIKYELLDFNDEKMTLLNDVGSPEIIHFDDNDKQNPQYEILTNVIRENSNAKIYVSLVLCLGKKIIEKSNLEEKIQEEIC